MLTVLMYCVLITIDSYALIEITQKVLKHKNIVCDVVDNVLKRIKESMKLWLAWEVLLIPISILVRTKVYNIIKSSVVGNSWKDAIILWLVVIVVTLYITFSYVITMAISDKVRRVTLEFMTKLKERYIFGYRGK